MTVAEIQDLAALARIELTDEEARSMASEFDAILGYVAQVEAAVGEARAEPEVGAHANVLREDTAPHEADRYTEALLAASPSREGRYVRVKKVLP